MERRSRRYDDVQKSGEATQRRSTRHDDMTSKEFADRRYERRKQKRYESESHHAEKRESREWEKRARLHHDGRDEDDRSQRSRVHNINAKETSLGISDEASWHATYKDSAYVFVGGIPFDLTEGDVLAVFPQYGEVVDLNLVRDKDTGKSKGFAFVAYEDQRSTILAVDNLNRAQLWGRKIRADHVSNYKKETKSRRE
ncbi:RNA-binding motif protein, X-linked 2 [Capsicum annuum]|nr:RNA-binding motif protein, X-linked 2 [Capsicum annuum]